MRTRDHHRGKQGHKRPIFAYGKRVNLSPIEETDVERLYQWINDFDIRKYITVWKPMTMSDEKEFIKNRGGNIIFAVMDKKSGRHIGVAGLHEINWRNGTATFGFMIGAKQYWGNGCGTDTLALILRYAFQTLNLWKVKSAVVALNGASFRCHEKCGFKKVGTYRKEWFLMGNRHDVFLLEINRDEWHKIAYAK